MTQQLSLDLIQNRLDAHAPLDLSEQTFKRQAAVSIILRESSNQNVELLFIRRADREGDPWSGHMAFPGGHLETSDPNLKFAAIRETREEIGITLDQVQYLGPLDHMHANPRGRNLDMLIAPHVFVLHEPQRAQLNYEVAEVVWTPLKPIFTGDNHTTKDLLIGGKASAFSGYTITDQHFVWGLTYRMLHSLFCTIDTNWLAPD